MNPTLREPELLEIVPYGSRRIEVGDVIFFKNQELNQRIVHRVVRLSPQGIATRGDNNSQEDHYRIKKDDVLGQIVAAWRGSKRRTIPGGKRGIWISRGVRWECQLDRTGSHLLHPFCRAIPGKGVLFRILPKFLRPKIVAFKFDGHNQPGLFLGKRLIGRYNRQSQEWQIHRPFQRMVDVSALPTEPFQYF